MDIKVPNSLRLTQQNTPIIPLKIFSSQFANYQIWLKRDDFTGIELSGNKVRKLDFLLAEALDNGANHIITCGGIQSNHCRTAAYMSVKTGLKCTLFLRGDKNTKPAGNHFLDILAGVKIKYVTSEQYQEIELIMSDYTNQLKSQNEKPYIIPEGGSNATGAWGYISCYKEIIKQTIDLKLTFDAIVVATGSGGTHAGLLFGKKIHPNDFDIISVNVCDSAEFFKNKILQISRDFEVKYDYPLGLLPEDVNIIDGYAGEGYGIFDSHVGNIIRELASSEGILLDPVYTAKAFYGLKSVLKKKKLPGKNILFIHTGGIFGLFPAVNDLEL